MIGNSSTFSLAPWARAKVVLMGSNGALFDRVRDSVRSLQETEYYAAEHTAPKGLASASTGPSRSRSSQAAIRHWFWNRKPARGFVVSGFPANRTEASVFDAWLDERDEALTACLWLRDENTSRAPATDQSAVADHYATQGNLVVVDATDASDATCAAVTDLVASLTADR